VSRPPLVYAIGDSLVGSEAGPKQTLFHLQAIAGDSITFKSQGISGNQTAQVVERVGRDVIEHVPKPDVCIVLAGINDIAWNVTATEITGNLETVYRRLLDADIQPLAILLYPFGGHGMWTAEFETVRQEVRSWMRDWLPVHLPQVEVIDMDDVIIDPSRPDRPSMRPDYADKTGMHTSPAGAAAVAQALMERSRSLALLARV
jgi:lysophospholipase L1-like esterase